MSIKNEDRHGLKNLTHERVKPLDKAHIPPYVIFITLLLPFTYYMSKFITDNET